MSAPIDVQIIRGKNGKPEFAVLPYRVFRDLIGARDYSDHVPHEVVSKMVDGATAAQAWREHLGMTQAEIASRIGITQSAYSQLENSVNLRPASRRRIAAALGISASQLVAE